MPDTTHPGQGWQRAGLAHGRGALWPLFAPATPPFRCPCPVAAFRIEIATAQSRRGLAVMAGERLDHILKSCRIAHRQDMAIAVRVQRLAIPVAHGAARPFDDREQALPSRKASDPLRTPGRGGPKRAARNCSSRRPSPCGGGGASGQRHEMRAVMIIEIMRSGGGQHRL